MVALRLLRTVALLTLLVGGARLALAEQRSTPPSRPTPAHWEHRGSAATRLPPIASPLTPAAMPRLRGRGRPRRIGLSRLAPGLTSRHWRATKRRAVTPPHALGHLRLTFDMFEARELSR